MPSTWRHRSSVALARLVTATGSGAATVSNTLTLDVTPPACEFAYTQRAGENGASLSFTGTADAANFADYMLELVDPVTGNSLQKLFADQLPVVNGIFGAVDTTTIANGTYHVQLTVNDLAGKAASTAAMVFLSSQYAPDNTPPIWPTAVTRSSAAPPTPRVTPRPPLSFRSRSPSSCPTPRCHRCC